MDNKEKPEVRIVWLSEWKTYRVCLSERPQKSLGYSGDLKEIMEYVNKKFPDRNTRVFGPDPGEDKMETKADKKAWKLNMAITLAFIVGAFMGFCITMLHLF